MTPLRQFKGVPQEVIRKAEGKQFVSKPLPSNNLRGTEIFFSRGIVTSTSTPLSLEN